LRLHISRCYATIATSILEPKPVIKSHTFRVTGRRCDAC
jgi:hypothetical protein